MLSFKTEELEYQFYHRLDPRLRAFHLETADYVQRRFGKVWVITCVNRDQPDSSHGHKRGVDARSTQFTSYEKREIMLRSSRIWGADLAPIGQRTDDGRKKFLRMICHIGTAEHFHTAINSSHAIPWLEEL